MKDVRTREPASPTAILQTELARDSSLKTVSEFDKSNLKKAETMEKNPLPSSEAIAQELEHLKFKAGIEGYDQSSLSHATTVEKNTLPTQVSPLTDSSTLSLDRICFAFEMLNIELDMSDLFVVEPQSEAFPPQEIIALEKSQ